METLTQPSRSRAALRSVFVFLISSVIALAGTWALAAVADAHRWCCVHSWALAHGTGLVVLLLFGLLGFHLVSIVGVRLGLLSASSRFGWLAHAAYIGGALATLFLTQQFMWLGLLAGVSSLVLRLRGHVVPRFGLAVVGLVVSVLASAQWLYMVVLFSNFKHVG